MAERYWEERWRDEKAANERLIEDRARFPDRPDDVGRMIEVHIGNLKLAKDEADRHARNVATENERLQITIWQLKGALGYPVPGDVPQGNFKCGLCEAKTAENKRLLADNDSMAEALGLAPRADLESRRND